jgi:hypothetical protein
METIEKANARESMDAAIIRGAAINEQLRIKGKFTAKCFDKDGKLKWEADADNVVTDVGANQLLDSAFGSGPVAGPFLGLISSVGYTGIPVAADTMSSHSSGGHVWVEAGNGSNYPNWSTPASNARAAVSFATASGRAKALSAVASFVIATNGGTVKGCFLVFGTGAVATNNSTAGVLYSAGVFSGGDKVLQVGDTLNVSYSTSI